MTYFGPDSNAPVADSPVVAPGLVPLLLAVGFSLLWAGSRPAPAQSQDTIQAAGTLLVPNDSAKARRLLRADLGPTSRRWTGLRDSVGRGRVAKTFFRTARLAYPSDTRADSMLSFLREAGTEHPNPEVRAEFLFGGLQIASSAGRDEVQKQFYQRLTDGYEGSHYATQARRLYAPESQIATGKTLPTFDLPRLTDSTATFRKSDFKGRVFLIDFWGTWCGPCIQAMPHLHEAYQKYGGEDFTILSVAMRDTRDAVKAFRANKWQMPWHHAFVPKGSDLQKRLRGRFEITGLPSAILVGPDGEILHVSRGVGSGKEIARAIQTALAGDGPSGNAPLENASSRDADAGGSTP